MKGQVSLEYLMLSIVGLALVSFSLISLGDIKSSMDRNIELSRFRGSALSLHDSISAVCAAGMGNSRKITLSAPLSLETEETDAGLLVAYSGKEGSIVKKTYCDVEEGDYHGEVTVENDYGKITIR